MFSVGKNEFCNVTCLAFNTPILVSPRINFKWFYFRRFFTDKSA